MTTTVPRSTPFVSTSAPVSPLRQAVAGLVVALASVLGLLAKIDIEVSPELATAIVSAAFACYGLLMDRRARREQAAGVVLLEQARAELPPGAIAADSIDGEILR